MATFVLVHGSGCGGWVWKKVAPLLSAAGDEVYTPTLTGLADRAHLLRCGVDLTTHITDVAELLFYEDLSEVVLVGNSYGGMVITGVAAKVPERLKVLLFLVRFIAAEKPLLMRVTRSTIRRGLFGTAKWRFGHSSESGAVLSGLDPRSGQ